MSNGYIATKADAANPHIIRNLRDVAEANRSMEPVDEVARQYDRMASEKGMENLRAQAAGDAKEFAFRVAVRNLSLPPVQISAAVPRLFALLTEATAAEESGAATEEVTTTSLAEENDLSIRCRVD